MPSDCDFFGLLLIQWGCLPRVPIFGFPNKVHKKMDAGLMESDKDIVIEDVYEGDMQSLGGVGVDAYEGRYFAW